MPKRLIQQWFHQRRATMRAQHQPTFFQPRQVSPNAIKDIILEATYLGGQKVYAAPPKAVALIPQPPINYGDGNYGDGDEEENEHVPN